MLFELPQENTGLEALHFHRAPYVLGDESSKSMWKPIMKYAADHEQIYFLNFIGHVYFGTLLQKYIVLKGHFIHWDASSHKKYNYILL
jgi:hypothetical protein